jgi:GNAT superfamily N-acetyltransferase
MKVESLADNAALLGVMDSIHGEAWPAFLTADAVVRRHWQKLYESYPQYQLLFRDQNDYVGLANCSSIEWDGSEAGLPTGFDEAVQVIMEKRATANCLCALAVVVRKEYSGRGISSEILGRIKEMGSQNGFSKLIIPVRPILKHKYPLIPMASYMRWTRSGLPFDPWLRVHVKAGGRIVKEAMPSMTVTGTVAEWQAWTGMHFGGAGDYVVEGALNPVRIDLQNDAGVYVEPNVWVVHDC